MRLQLTRAELSQYALLLVTALAVGDAVTQSPRLAVGAVVSLIVAGALTLGPPWLLGPALLLGSAIVPTVLYKIQYAGSSLAITPLGSQGRLLICLAAIAILRVRALDRAQRPRRQLRWIVGLFVAQIVFALSVSLVRGSLYGGFGADLYRQLTFPLACLIMVVAGLSASTDRDRLRLLASLAVSGCIAYLAAIAYWAWATGRFALPGLTSIFALVRDHSVYLNRSVYPFLQDSPNGQAIEMGMLAAAIAPPLLARSERRFRVLGALMLTLAAAAVLTTQSRTGIIALAALPLLWLISRSGRRSRVLVATAVVFGVGVLLTAHQLFPSSRGISLHSSTFVARQTIWSQAVNRFESHPAFGEGFYYSSRPNFIDLSAAAASTGTIHQSIENQYLGEFVDGGIVGGALFVCLLISLVAMGMAGRTSSSKLEASEADGFIGCLVVLAVGMVATAPLQSAGVATMFWMIVGLAATSHRSVSSPKTSS